MTKQLFFDTDCLSSFLWVKQENILLNLYPGRIVLPQAVFAELSNPSIPHIKNKVDSLCLNREISTKDIPIGTEEYYLFNGLAFSPAKGAAVIGKGEAAALSLAKVYDGIIASNNMKDISRYIEKYKLTHITTGDILVSALNARIIDEVLGNQIWSSMLSKRRLLPTVSFSDYLKRV